jgi:hypothetical protein
MLQQWCFWGLYYTCVGIVYYAKNGEERLILKCYLKALILNLMLSDKTKKYKRKIAKKMLIL